MKFSSTRAKSPPASLSDVIAAGLAPDGGLYVPESLPQMSAHDFNGCELLPDIAARLLAPFFADDALDTELPAICAEAFSFPAALRALRTPGDFMLELFHGPTAAFKDYGAQFLAACLRRIPRTSNNPLTILVATSGDTGAAVAAAFHDVPGFRVVILYPDGRVSPRQAHQLGCFGGNVQAFYVGGNFDDCQRLVKQALGDRALRDDVPMSSANSISLGRLLPQMAYYAQATLSHYREQSTLLNFVVPTGNLGNALACMMARKMGLPIGRIVLATNANATLRDFFSGADYAPRPSIATLANAMDVGAPSNFERLRWLYPDANQLRRTFAVDCIGDAAIQATIREFHQASDQAVCPHTATAIRTLRGLRQEGADGDWVAVATAHPAKFDSIVEALIDAPVPIPPALASLLALPSTARPLGVDYAALRLLLAES
ncbi:MAG: threonine synthase [Rudaea sp.]